MRQWHKHVLGFVMPLTVGATVLALAPEYDAPDWMITVSAAGIAIAIGYAMYLYHCLAKRGGNYFIAPAAIFVVGVVGWLAGIMMHSSALAGLGALLPVAPIMLASGYLSRRMAKADNPS